MKRLLRIATGRPDASASALRAAAAAAAPTASGVAFVDNSQGASQAAAELSAALGTALDQIDFEGTLDETLRRFVHRLDEVASDYDNSRLRDGGAGQAPWECTQHTAQLVSIAWACALDAYTATAASILAETDTATYRFERDWVGAPSVGGTVKTLTSTVVSPLADAVDNDNTWLPVLVIAVCGTVTTVDHMVNANGRPVDAVGFVGTCYGADVRAHAGFLNSADALDDTALARISSYVRAQKARGANAHVLFAGHSAGGAVASLLYLRYRGRQEFARFSCITFGAPPAVSLPLTAVGSSGTDTDSDSNDPVCLSLINEFDLVSRADTPYVVSVASLFRAAQQKSLPRGEDKPVVLEVEQEDEDEGRDEKSWPLPRALFHHVGHVVVLAMRLEGDSDGDGDGDGGGVDSAGAGAVQLRAVRVNHGVLERLLFCRVAVHRRACYDERARLLARGEFNGLKGWVV